MGSKVEDSALIRRPRQAGHVDDRLQWFGWVAMRGCGRVDRASELMVAERTKVLAERVRDYRFG